MSIAVMTLVWASDVPAPQRMTLLALADAANDDGVCWPSIRLLASKTQAGESTVRRHLQSLEADGLLSSQQRFNASAVYRIDVAALKGRPAREIRTRSESPIPASAPAAAPSPTPSQSGTPSQIDTPPDLSGPPPNLSTTPLQSEHLTVIDPSVEPSSPPDGGDAREHARAGAEGPAAVTSLGRRQRRRDAGHRRMAETARSGAAVAIVETWAATCTRRPGPRVTTRLGVEVDVLLKRGWPDDLLLDALAAWASKGLGETAFQSVANEVANRQTAPTRTERAAAAADAAWDEYERRHGDGPPVLRITQAGS
ncbi:hypothetical protein DMP17_22025 [Pseudonocardia sp. TMWB2A]|uniref:helix-turn-helix domain-containing protein n=1 Tax=Pseudonocardia sp. TMWB2A TaxID=687430 RepID=UPI00307D4A62